MKLRLHLFLFFLPLSVMLVADEYFVITNKNMQSLASSKVKAIFLKKLSYVGTLNLVPINLKVKDPLRLKFEKRVLHMGFSRLKNYWISQHYLGHRPPISMKSQESIKAFVKRVDGAIGYINAQNMDDDLQIIYRWRD